MDIGPERVSGPVGEAGSVQRIEPKRGLRGFGDHERQESGSRRQSEETDEEPQSDAVDVSAEYLASHEATAVADGGPDPAVETEHRVDFVA